MQRIRSRYRPVALRCTPKRRRLYWAAAAALRDARVESEIEPVVERIREVARRTQIHAGRSPFAYLRLRWVRHVVLLAVGIAVVQQNTGINTIVYYATTTLCQTGFPGDVSLTATIDVGLAFFHDRPFELANEAMNVQLELCERIRSVGAESDVLVDKCLDLSHKHAAG